MMDEKEISRTRKLFSESDKSMALAFKALSDVNRYRIFRILAQETELSVSNIALILDISLPLASQHIKVLTDASMLQKERDGKKIFPRLEQSNPFVQAMAITIQQAKIRGLR